MSQPWLSNIPHDLKQMLDEIEGSRATLSQADRWCVIKEWLEHHSINAPTDLPADPEIKSGDHGSNS